MASDSKRLQNLIKQYIDSMKPATPTFKQALATMETKARFQLVWKEKGDIYRSDSSITVAACIRDLEALHYLLQDFSPIQKFAVVNTLNSSGLTPLHLALCNRGTEETRYSSIDIIDYLLKDISTDNQFELLTKQNTYGNTMLHLVAKFGHLSALEHILTALSPDRKEQLLGMKNNNKLSVADMAVPVLFSAVGEGQKKTEALAKAHDEQMKTQMEVNNRLEKELKESKEKLKRRKITIAQQKKFQDEMTKNLFDLQKQLKMRANRVDELEQEVYKQKARQSETDKQCTRQNKIIQEMAGRLAQLEVILLSASCKDENGLLKKPY
ncbi:golgin subfamily A member 6-like protein 2 [Watersipora subatra]|uniref:golgin subfamily A member 6-like protein 2 n=1 Tax=Watersipora subatra TaxID=2589382 RepID=UPI00355C8BE0